MTQTALHGAPEAAAPIARGIAWGVSAAWLTAGFVAAVLTWALGPPGAGREALALAFGAAPAVITLGSAGREGAAGRIVVLAWTIGGGLASLLAGGAAGPLAVWCLTPLMVAVMLRRADLLPLAGAGALAALALSTFGAMLFHLAAPPAVLTPWLSVLSVGGFAAALGAVLLSVYGEAARVGRGAERLQGVFVEQPQLLLAVAPDGRMEGVVGHPPPGVPVADMVGRNLISAVVQAQRLDVQQALRRAAVEGSAEIGFTPVDDASGWVVLSLRRASAQRLVGSMRDARGPRAREAELERAREQAESQNAGKSRFLANMSHELRTPLNAIMGFSDIMRQRMFGPISDRYADYAELIHESGGHLLELINDVLDMSKIEADRYELAREEFDAREAVSAVLRLMRGQADRAGVQLRGVLPREPLEADADRRAVKQIVMNLISNALKF
ncbi:MAG: histidine kinase dimerization/phospho-acceptor domain-containing protein, partial [Phenylobacterium sp.]|uniref:sensor histidine kinase n=1 Tax=Phenylobacterium sp. TaxID=1871053 RepID=UPI002736EFF4